MTILPVRNCSVCRRIHDLAEDDIDLSVLLLASNTRPRISNIASHKGHESTERIDPFVLDDSWLLDIKRLIPPQQIDEQGAHGMCERVQFQQTQGQFRDQSADALNAEPAGLEADNGLD